MTQEHKELLLRDLCARLPYGVKVNIPDLVFSSKNNIEVLKEIFYGDDGEFRCNDSGMLIKYVKPYLFPLSSMAEEEWEDYQKIRMIDWVHGDINGTFINAGLIVNWLNAHHFDYRNLINKNLAIDCTNLNIY